MGGGCKGLVEKGSSPWQGVLSQAGLKGCNPLCKTALAYKAGSVCSGPIAGKPAPTGPPAASQQAGLCEHPVGAGLPARQAVSAWALSLASQLPHGPLQSPNKQGCASILWERACPRCRRRWIGPCAGQPAPSPIHGYLSEGGMAVQVEKRYPASPPPLTPGSCSPPRTHRWTARRTRESAPVHPSSAPDAARHTYASESAAPAAARRSAG